MKDNLIRLSDSLLQCEEFNDFLIIKKTFSFAMKKKSLIIIQKS